MLWRVQVGDVIAGKYRVDRILGQGGMGMVVRATHRTLDEPVAVKFLLPEMLASPSVVERFLREARAAAKIKSEHVVRVFDVDRLESGTPYIVMEYLDGADLASLMKARPDGLPVEQAVGYLLQACEALALAHARGIVHRDIKPANLFLARSDDGAECLKVLDFGVSKLSATKPGDKSDITRSLALLGSPRYMSPEQFRAPHEVDARTDVWALGVVLYRLLTGALPFDFDNPFEVWNAVQHEAPAPPRALRPELPEKLEAAVLECLERDVEQRIQSVRALAARLAPFAPASLSELYLRIERIGAGSLPDASGDRSADFSRDRGAETSHTAATQKNWANAAQGGEQGGEVGDGGTAQSWSDGAPPPARSRPWGSRRIAIASMGSLAVVGGALWLWPRAARKAVSQPAIDDPRAAEVATTTTAATTTTTPTTTTTTAATTTTTSTTSATTTIDRDHRPRPSTPTPTTTAEHAPRQASRKARARAAATPPAGAAPTAAPDETINLGY